MLLRPPFIKTHPECFGKILRLALNVIVLLGIPFNPSSPVLREFIAETGNASAMFVQKTGQ